MKLLDRRLVTVGHVLIDLRFRVDKIPKPDEEAEILLERRGVGGSAANVAIVAKRFGLRSSIIAKIGFDHFGRIALDELMKEGVEVSGIKISTRLATGFSLVSIGPKGEIILMSYKGASASLSKEDLSYELLSKADYIHIASLDPNVSREVLKLSKPEALVTWDPGRRVSGLGINALSDIIANVNVVLVNSEESYLLTKMNEPIEAAKMIKKLGPKVVIIKMGEKGAYALIGNKGYKIDPCPVDNVIDTTGAGDTFAAGLIASVARGYEFLDAAKIASVAAAIKVSKLGSHEVPSFNEVIRYAEERGCI